MNETTVGYLVLGVGLLLVLSLVFVVTLRANRPAGARPAPPRGVHLPPPSLLPVIMSVGALLLGAGLIFKPDEAIELPLLSVVSGVMHPIIGPLGLAVLVYGIWGWVRDAGHEWRETESGPHDDAAGH